MFSNSGGFLRASTHLGSLGFVRCVLRVEVRECIFFEALVKLPPLSCLLVRVFMRELTTRATTRFFIVTRRRTKTHARTHSLTTTGILETNSEIIYVKYIVM